MTQKFIHMQTIIQFRIPILDSGNLGNPEILKKFTTEFKGSQVKYKKKKKEPITIKAVKQDVSYF